MSLRITTALLLAATALAGCQPAPPAAPDPTGRADADMARVLAAYQASGARPVYALTVEQARTQPTPGDAAAQVARQSGRQATITLPKITEIPVSGAGGLLPARVYDPQAGINPAPVILYFHGGGWVTGTLDTYDSTDRALARATGAIVVSVQVRRAPEHRFPAAQEDAKAAYKWLAANAKDLGGDPDRIALAGESAGGNLAINTALWARTQPLPAPVHQLLIYPVVGTDLNTPSYAETTDAVPLNRRAVQWYLDHFINARADLRDPRLDVVGAADLRGLPPTTVVSAAIDPLRSEGEALANRLRAAGVPVEQRTFPGVTHEFFGMGAAVGEARLAESFAAARLNAAFAAKAPAPPVPRGRAARRAR